MNTTTHNGSSRQPGSRRHSFFASEAVWQLALVTVVFVAILDEVLSIGGGTIA